MSHERWGVSIMSEALARLERGEWRSGLGALGRLQKTSSASMPLFTNRHRS